MDFEKNLKALEKIVEKMGAEKLNLTDALKDFQKGMDLVKKCEKDLSSAEQKVEKLLEVSPTGKIKTEPFNTSDIES